MYLNDWTYLDIHAKTFISNIKSVLPLNMHTIREYTKYIQVEYTNGIYSLFPVSPYALT